MPLSTGHGVWKKGHTKMKAGRASYVVVLDKIYSPALIVPNYYIEGNTSSTITLKEFPNDTRLFCRYQ